jgi:hypothetical protein
MQACQMKPAAVEMKDAALRADIQCEFCFSVMGNESIIMVYTEKTYC